MLRITRVALQRAGLLLFAWCCLLVAGCANFYVDKGLPEVAASELKAPSKPRPVQLFFQFETKGSANARATELLKAQVVDLVTRSGLFAAVQDAPSTDSGTLQITINNVPLSDDAMAKGFVTGLTLGLAGSVVGDGYVCNLQYKASDSATPIDLEVHHAIYTSIGATSGPEHATKVDNGETAIRTVARQAVMNLLLQLSQNAQFQGAP